MDMNPLPQTSPLSDMNKRPNEVLAQLENGPVALLQRSQPAAVMLSPAIWNAIVAEMEKLQDFVDVLEAQLELATGKDKVVTMSEEDIAEWMNDAVPA